jgi:RimJ/RimL family protein N-acetyltransferase
MGSIEALRTPRLRLERVRAPDRSDLARLYRDPRVMATLGGVRSAQEIDLGLARMLGHWERHGFGVWLLREAGTGEFVGRGGLQSVSLEGRDEVEVLYALLPEFQGRGLATELARESVRVAFEVLGLPDLVCFTAETNAASRRVMERAGFRYERAGVRAGTPHVFYRLGRPA